jgi:hypothetical protein
MRGALGRNERIRQQHNCYMMMPPFPRATFELIKRQYLFGLFVELLDGPPKMGVASQFFDGPIVYSPAQPCAQFVCGVLNEEPSSLLGNSALSDPFDHPDSCPKELLSGQFFRPFCPRYCSPVVVCEAFSNLLGRLRSYIRRISRFTRRASDPRSVRRVFDRC